MIDSLDLKILSILQKDARTAFADIAKELNVTPGIVQARYNKMKKSGLIKGSTLVLKMDTLGTMFTASIGIKALESELEGVNNFIKGLKIQESIIFSWTTFGRYNIATAIFSKNLLEVHKIKQLIKQHPSVQEVSISLGNISANDESNPYESLDLERIFRM